jgi:hypothetical protein
VNTSASVAATDRPEVVRAAVVVNTSDASAAHSTQPCSASAAALNVSASVADTERPAVVSAAVLSEHLAGGGRSGQTGRGERCCALEHLGIGGGHRQPGRRESGRGGERLGRRRTTDNPAVVASAVPVNASTTAAFTLRPAVVRPAVEVTCVLNRSSRLMLSAPSPQTDL